MMKMDFAKKASIKLPVIRVAVSCCLLGGCFDSEHYTHRDFVSSGAGDAVAVNAATQTITPWPKQAKDPNVDIDGKRIAAAVQRYEDNRSIPPLGLSTSDVTQQAAAAAQAQAQAAQAQAQSSSAVQR